MLGKGNHLGPTFLPRMSNSVQTSLKSTSVRTPRQLKETLNERHLVVSSCLVIPGLRRVKQEEFVFQDQPGLYTKRLSKTLPQKAKTLNAPR